MSHLSSAPPKLDARDYLIYDLVLQSCHVANNSEYQIDSGFIRCFADAMDYLHHVGMIELLGGADQGNGRGRLAKLKAVLR